MIDKADWEKAKIQFEGMMIKDALPLIWSNEVDSPTLAAIISFYFGSRAFSRK